MWKVTFSTSSMKPYVQKDYNPYDTQGNAAYMKNLRQEIATQQQQPDTTRSMLGKLYRLSSFDPQGAEEGFNLFHELQNTRGSQFYDPFVAPTNKAVSNLAAYGIDAKSLTDDWFEQNNSWIASNLLYNGTTNTPSSPGKKATDQQRVAYELYQYKKSEDATKRAEDQWKALQEELKYKAQNQNLNMSDDDIIQSIDWKKYSELDSMEKSKDSFQLNEYNRAIGYSRDAMYGVLWAARNNGGTGDIYKDMAMSSLGLGNVWQNDSSIKAKLTKGTEDYAPYSVDMTCHEEGLYFNRDHFDQKWVDDNKYMLNSPDKTQRDFYISVAKAEGVTQSAEKENEALKSYVDKLIQEKKSEDTIQKLVLRKYNSNEYPTLKSMDESLQYGGEDSTHPLVKTTRKVDYRLVDVQDYIRERCAQKKETEVDAPELVAQIPKIATVADLPVTVSPAAFPKANAMTTNVPTYSTDLPLASPTDLVPINTPAGSTGGMGSAEYANGVAGMNNMQTGVQPGTPEVQTSPVGAPAGGAGATGNTDFASGVAGKGNTQNANVQVGTPNGIYQSVVTPAGTTNEPGSLDYTGRIAGRDNLQTGGTGSNVFIPETAKREPVQAEQLVIDVTKALMKDYGKHDESIASMSAREIDAKVRDTSAVLQDELKPSESAAISGWSTVFEDAQKAWDTVKQFASKLAGAIVTVNARSSMNSYIENSLSVYNDITNYEATKDKVVQLKAKQKEYTDQLGYFAALVEKPEDNFEVTMNGKTYQVWLNPDLTDVESIAEYRDDFAYYLEPRYGLYESPEEWDQDARTYDQIRNSDAVRSRIERAAQKSEQIANIKSLGLTEALMTPEQKEILKAYRDAQVAIEDAEQYLHENEATYQKAVETYDKYANKYIAQGSLMVNLGLDTTDLIVGDVVMKSLTKYSKYEPTKWDAFTAGNIYSERLNNARNYPEDETKTEAELFQDAEKDRAETDAELQDAEWLKKYVVENKIKLPDSWMENLNRDIAQLSRRAADLDAFMLQKDPNFTQKAEAGRLIEFGGTEAYSSHKYFLDVDNGKISEDRVPENALLARVGRRFYDAMTQTEKDTYYYLLNEDEEEAIGYINRLADPTYGVLETRATILKVDEWKDYTEKNFVLANVLATLEAPIASFNSAAYFLYNLFTGQEWNPYSSFLSVNNTRKAVREQSAQEILNTFGDENGNPTTMSKIAQFGYDMLVMRADSAMNAATFGNAFSGLFGEGSFWAKAAGEFFGASTMGFSAAADSASDAKIRGATDTQAYGIAAITFLAETITEAISLDNMREAAMIGEKVTNGAYKEFLKNWITNAGFSEAIGESLNEYIENRADELIMGANSEHANRVYQYRILGYGPDEAEYMARKDETVSIMRTALLSYLSPGLDAFQTVSGQQKLYRSVRDEMNVGGGQYTLRDAREKVIEEQQTARKLQREAEERANLGDAGLKGLNLDVAQTPAQIRAEQQAARQQYETFAVESEILETAQHSDWAAHDASVAVVLDVGGTVESRDAAKAAAANMHDVLGYEVSPAEALQELLDGVIVGKSDPALVKQGFQFAALGGEESASRRLLQSDNYQKATPDVKAAALAKAAQKDMMNQNVQNAVQTAIHDHRVAVAEAGLIAQGVADEAVKADARLDSAISETAKAEANLNNQQMVEKAKADIAKQAADKAISEPTVENVRAQGSAALDQVAAAAVTQELEQSHANALEKQETVQQEADRIKKQAMATVRQQAEQIVADEDQQREEAKARQEEIDRLAAEVREKAIKEEQANNSISRMEADEFIRRYYGNATEEQKEIIRPVFLQERLKMGYTSEGFLKRGQFIKAIENKFGYKINVSDTSEGGTKALKNAYIKIGTNEIVLDPYSTVDDIMYAIMCHELTHGAEQSETYNELADIALKIQYGDDVSYKGTLDRMNAGDLTSQIAQDILQTKDLYDKTLKNERKQKHSYEEILQEIVADSVGRIISGDEKAINTLVTEKPNVARRFLNSIKSFLKKAVGIESAPITQAQKVAEMLETALTDVQKNNLLQEDAVKHSMGQNVLVENDQGNTLAVELPGGTVAVNPMAAAEPVNVETGEVKYSLSSFTKDEQDRVRQALYNKVDANGKKEFTRKQVDKYLSDAMSIASVIAADRSRLDFKASDNQVFLKPNNDYFFTLDASTLCAKRLLYQGTFDYVQHALPDEVFTPEDLIDLVNIMNDMGYETPCGICYVESRRRWLDTYAQKFLDELPDNADGFIEEYFKKASNEEKDTIREHYTEWNPTIDDLTTSDGLEKLRHANPFMYKAFVDAMNAKGSANPKVVQLRTEYRGDIGKLTANDIQKVKDIGGLRIQSFSDFETPHLLDMVQAVLDMSAKGLTSQAYTKVPNFAWVFGDTGIKINLSLIGKGTGLDENGNLVFDNREGIDFDEAMKIRERYGKNVGTILVGINDDHIVAAMGDPRIDFIIPFHKSGWSAEELRKMPTLNNYKDYTSTQNERYIVERVSKTLKEWKTKNRDALQKWIDENGEDYVGYRVEETEKGFRVVFDGYKTESFEKHKKRTGESLSNLEPVGANQYWNFKKSGQWNAENYLKMCAEQHRMPKFWQFLVDNGDGSFSLPTGTDKRSTSIREGYWKTLIDFKMYENDGYGRTTEDGTRTKVKGAEQKEVTPNINMSEAYRVLNDYKLGRQMPDKADGTKGKFIPMESNNSVPVAVPAAEEYIELIKRRREGTKPTGPNPDTLEADLPSYVNPKANAFGASQAPAVLGNTESTATNQMASQQQNAMAIDAETGETVRIKNSLPSDASYLDAVKRGNMEAAQQLVDEKAKEAGYNLATYHGTGEYFNEFKRGYEGIHLGNEEQARQVAGDRYRTRSEKTNYMWGEIRDSIDGMDNEQRESLVNAAYNRQDDFPGSNEPPFEGDVSDANAVKDYVEKILNNFKENSGVSPESVSFRMRTYDRKTSERVMNLYAKINNPFVINGDIGQWDPAGIAGVILRRAEGENSITDYGYKQVDISGTDVTLSKDQRAKLEQLNSMEIRGDEEKWNVLSDVLNDMGFDGIKYLNTYEGDKNSYSYIALNPSDVKSADPVTYDDAGNVIPISERFNTKSNDIRYSLPSDAPYLSAVDHGDTSEAQRIIDERAKEAGYIKAGYHGTLNGGFTIFDKSFAGIGGNSGAGFYFSSNPSDSEANYSDVEGADNWFKANHLADKILEEFRESDEEEFEYEGYPITEGMDYKDVVEIAKKILTKNPQTYHVYLDQGKAYIRDFNNSTNLIEDVADNFDESQIDRNDYDDEDEYYEAVSDARYEAIAQAISDAVYNGFADVESNYEIFADVNYEDIIGRLTEIAMDYDTLTWSDLVKVLEEQYIDIGTENMDEPTDGSREIARAIIEAFGYDSIEDREVSKKFNQLKNMGNAGDTAHYIMFRPEQIKLADPVTYDNDGNVIPPSARFNTEHPDIRYSLPSEPILRQQIQQYLEGGGSLTEETVPQEDNLPGTPGMRPQRQFGHKTSQESDALHEEVKQYLYNHSSYTPDTNAAQIDRAMDWVQQHANMADPEGYYAALQEAESADFDYRSADGQARMLTLMGMAALKGDTASELRLADAYNKQGTDLGRMLQARKLFRLMTPLGRVSTLQQEVNRINDDYARQGSNRRVGLSEWTLRAAEVAETEEDFQKVQHAAAQELAEQMPANWKDKLTGWRMLSMLGNPRTHIRNVLGNALFMPMVGMKNEIAALAELGMSKENRTKTVGLATKDARAFAKQDAQAIRDTLTGEAKYKDGDLVQQERKTWGTGKSLVSRTLGKALQAASDFNSKALEAEDWVFLNRHYRNALAGYMTARGLTSKDMTGKTLEDARTYAVQEAQKATYRDANSVAASLSNIQNKWIRFGVNAVLPFKKTPANILKRGLEYSPAGIMKALTADAKHLKQYMDYQNGKLQSLPEKAISPSQWIDKICSGLTGSAVMALGFLLSGMGAVKAGLDDDDEFDKLQGEQEYSINPGRILNKLFNVELFGEDISMTADWAAPFSMPFFVGATLYNALDTLNGGKEINVGAVADSILNITEPVFNLSMLDGVNSLLDVNAYGDGNPITKIVEKIATNYLTSFVPTLSGQAARTIDPVRRKAYVESGAEPSAILYALEQLENKLPFVSKSNIPYRNAWGEASEKETLAAGLENFLSPAYFNTIKNDAVTNELERLYNTVSDTNRSAMVPKMPGKTVGGEKLNAEQYDQLTVERGQTAKKLLTELMGDEAYAIADDETRAEMIKDVWTYCNQTANYNVSGGTTNVDKWVTAAKDDPVGAVVNRAVDRAKKEQTEGFTTQLKRAFAAGNLENAQIAIAGLRRAGKSDSSIKTTVTNIAKPIYQAAYLADDDDTMYEVEMMLDNLDDDLVWKYSGWLKNLDDVEEEEEEEPLEINWLNRNQ